MAFWGIELKPGKPYVHNYDDERGRLHVSQATLGDASSKKKAVVVCNVAGEKSIYLCSLLPGKMETCSLNVEFEENDEVTFSVEGPNSVHLSGFFFGEKPDTDGDDSGSDSYEEGGLGAEIDSGDDSDFDFDDEDDLTDNDMDTLPSLTMPNNGVRIEEIVDDEKPTDKNGIVDDEKPTDKNGILKKSKKNKQAVGNDDDCQRQVVLKNSIGVAVLESEENSRGKRNSEESIRKGKDEQSKRKKGADDSEHTAKRKKDDSVAGEGSASKPANVSASTPEVDIKKTKKNKKVKDLQEADQEQTCARVAEKTNDKKNKQQNTPGGKSPTEAKPFDVKSLPNGLVIEELQMGKPHGKQAGSGKKVSVCYIGKLKKNGKIFDSNVGKAPFKFRLGAGKVIKGWDIGVKGMRVGEKRRLTIPPALGYGARGAGAAIPPNSWLVFDVELIDVS